MALSELSLIEWLGLGGFALGLINLYLFHKKNKESKPRLIFENIYFNKFREGPSREDAIGDEASLVEIRVRINLRNLSTRPTTIENVSINIGNHHQKPYHFKPATIKDSSSQEFNYKIFILKEDYDNFPKKKGLFNLEVVVDSTFETIRKKGKADLKTGHFTLV